VPVVHRGPATAADLPELIGPSQFDSVFENQSRVARTISWKGSTCDRGRWLCDGACQVGACEFVERVKQSEHWQHQALVPNLLGKVQRFGHEDLG